MNILDEALYKYDKPMMIALVHELQERNRALASDVETFGEEYDVTDDLIVNGVSVAPLIVHVKPKQKAAAFAVDFEKLKQNADQYTHKTKTKSKARPKSKPKKEAAAVGSSAA